MPTLPSARAGLSELEPLQLRRIAESFGSDPDRYDRARPRYPQAMVERIVAESPGLGFLDVGIGTGIAARQFQAAGCKVLGVDVDARMADWARRHGQTVEVSLFEAWDAAGRKFDGVISGQTWHWVEPVAGAAKAAEVLRPGGRLAVFWKAGQMPPEVARPLGEVYRRLMPDSLASRAASAPTGAGYSSLSDRAADGMRRAGALARPEEWRLDWEQSYTRDEWLDLVPTQGDHTQLTPAKLDEVLSAVGAVIDDLGGSFTMGYTTSVVTSVPPVATSR
ncbi:MAG TPA: class I SAM-dependent methyltransferase [Acidimicrobiales bacterium]|nr:class I SAM-dependent methyltransferase [Acidimicrobiales bacterium]